MFLSYREQAAMLLGEPEPGRLDEVYKKLSWANVLTTLGIEAKPKPNSALISLCVFHREKSPSLVFYAPPRDHRYICYGCGLDGDIVMFLVHFHGLDTIEKLESFVEEFGVRRTDGQEPLPL